MACKKIPLITLARFAYGAASSSADEAAMQEMGEYFGFDLLEDGLTETYIQFTNEIDGNADGNPN